MTNERPVFVVQHNSQRAVVHGGASGSFSEGVTAIHFAHVREDREGALLPHELLTLVAQLEIRLSASGCDTSRSQLRVYRHEFLPWTFFRMSAPTIKPRKWSELWTSN